MRSGADHGRDRPRPARRHARSHAGRRAQGAAGLRRAHAPGEPALRSDGHPVAAGRRHPGQRTDPEPSWAAESDQGDARRRVSRRPLLSRPDRRSVHRNPRQRVQGIPPEIGDPARNGCGPVAGQAQPATTSNGPHPPARERHAHRCTPGNTASPTSAAIATSTGSGSFFTFQIAPTAQIAITAVVASTIVRSASTITAPVIAPIAAAVTPFTNASSGGRRPYFLKYGAGKTVNR